MSDGTGWPAGCARTCDTCAPLGGSPHAARVGSSRVRVGPPTLSPCEGPVCCRGALGLSHFGDAPNRAPRSAPWCKWHSKPRRSRRRNPRGRASRQLGEHARARRPEPGRQRGDPPASARCPGRPPPDLGPRAHRPFPAEPLRRVWGTAGWHSKSGARCRPGCGVGRLCQPVGGAPQQRPFQGLLGSQRPLLRAFRPAGTVRGPEPSLPRVQAPPGWKRGREAGGRGTTTQDSGRRSLLASFLSCPGSRPRRVRHASSPASAVRRTLAEHLPSPACRLCVGEPGVREPAPGPGPRPLQHAPQPPSSRSQRATTPRCPPVAGAAV